MSRLIPNEKTWVGFIDEATATFDPTGELSAFPALDVAAATPLASFITSLNASSQGNVLPTPSFDTLFETSISGTVSAQFSADFYRDNEVDTAWETFPRATKGYFIVSRFGGIGTDNLPEATDEVEVWPIIVTSRTMQGMGSNQVQMFSINCSVPREPDEAVVLA